MHGVASDPYMNALIASQHGQVLCQQLPHTLPRLDSACGLARLLHRTVAARPSPALRKHQYVDGFMHASVQQRALSAGAAAASLDTDTIAAVVTGKLLDFRQAISSQCSTLLHMQHGVQTAVTWQPCVFIHSCLPSVSGSTFALFAWNMCHLTTWRASCLGIGMRLMHQFTC